MSCWIMILLFLILRLSPAWVGGYQESGNVAADATVAPRTPPSACLGGGSQECDMDMAQGRNTPPMAQGPTYLDGGYGTWRCGDDDMNDGSVCSNKVASSSDAGGIVINEGSDSLNCSNSVAHYMGGTHSTPRIAKCKGKYRIKFKGAACHGRACCGEN